MKKGTMFIDSANKIYIVFSDSKKEVKAYAYDHGMYCGVVELNKDEVNKMEIISGTKNV